MQKIHEKKYDVVVCGSGCAGFCAAIQAARAGCKTAIIEKHGMPGGIMTVMGNNDVAQFNAHQKQIIKGIGWEFILELSKRGYADIPDFTMVDVAHWKFGVKVNIIAAAKLIDEMLLENNIDIFYNQPVVEVDTENDEKDSGRARIKYITISTKDGLKKIESSIFIDCTGDGDISAWAGAQFECGDETTGELQPGTIRFFTRRYNNLIIDINEIDETLLNLTKNGQLLTEDYMGLSVKELLSIDGDNCNHISHFNGADSDSKTKAEIAGRESVYRLMEAIKRAGKSADNIEINYCTPEVAVRESRRILCDSYITMEDYISAKSYDDSICYSFYPIDRHEIGDKGIFQIFLEDGIVPKIPLSALVPKGISNLYVAGRCASGDRNANSAFRVKASCMAMGQAAGAAAAVAVHENNGITRGINLSKVKEILIENNAIVPN